MRSNHSGKPPMERSSTSTRAAPRHPMSPASVTTSDGRPSLATHHPWMRPATAAAQSAASTASGEGDIVFVQGGQHAGRPRHHRCDREVDLAGDDDERHRHDDDHLLDVQLEEVDEVVDAEVAARLGDVEDDRSQQDHAEQQLPRVTASPAQPSPPPRGSARASVRAAARSRRPTAMSSSDGQEDQRAEDRVAPELADLLDPHEALVEDARSALRRGTRP